MKTKKIKLLTYKMYLTFMIFLMLTPSYKQKYNTGDVFYDNDLTLIDETNCENANIKLVNSYKVKDIYVMNKIIDELIEYKESNDIDNWNRTKKTLFLEWMAHNICYDLGIKRKSTCDVDFRESEEKMYSFCLKLDNN